MTSEITSTTAPTPALTFDNLADLLVRQGAMGSPAELHGNLCGYLAAGGRYSADNWLSTAAELLELTVLEDQALIVALSQLYDQSLKQLSGGDFSFELLVPDDEAPVSQRTESLGLWCHGFLSSYSIAGGELQSSAQLSQDAAESLQDLVQISQVAAMSEDEDLDATDDEADFAEVFEYVRMSALLVFAEINGMNIDAEDDTVADEGDGGDSGEVLH